MKAFHLIIGPMFSGKTTKLLEYYQSEEGEVKAFKPIIDKRYHINKIATHNGEAIDATTLDISANVDLNSLEADVVLFDEVQFFDEQVVELIEGILERGKKVVASGLNLDYRQKPFPTVEALKKIATQQTNLSARCHLCGQEAHFTFLKTPDLIKGQVLVGGDDIYEARCSYCHPKNEAQ